MEGTNIAKFKFIHCKILRAPVSFSVPEKNLDLFWSVCILHENGIVMSINIPMLWLIIPNAYHHDIFNSSHLIIQTYHWAKLNDNVGTANLLFSSGNWICIEIGIARQVIIKHDKCILKHVSLNFISITDGRLKLNVAVCLFCCEILFPFDTDSKDCLV